MEFPPEHWRQIRTNNPLERIMREIRRRTRVVGAFPDGNVFTVADQDRVTRLFTVHGLTPENCHLWSDYVLAVSECIEEGCPSAVKT